MTLQEIQYKAQSIISKWRDDDSAPYIEFVEELAHMIVPEPSEDLEEAAVSRMRDTDMYLSDAVIDEFGDELLKMAQFGAKWQKEQMMKEAVELELKDNVNYPSDWNQVGMVALYFYTSPTFKFGDKVRVIVVKE